MSACTPTRTLKPDEIVSTSVVKTLSATSTATFQPTSTPYDPEKKLLEEEMARVTLTAKEVQYDMSNNVDKEFILAGTGDLCDYYNWGYDRSIERSYFCVKVTPSGGYSESWYIYFHRTSFTSVYQDLLRGEKYMTIIAKIDSAFYERNQERMASAKIVEWSRQ